MGLDPTIVSSGMTEAAVHPRAWRGFLTAKFKNSAGRTTMEQAHHQGPLRIQKLLYPESPMRADVLVLHPPSGIAGGDDLEIDFHVQSGAACRFTTPGAGKWYRSNGPEAYQTVQLKVDDDACLEWLPQEAIVFDGARVNANTEIMLAPGARASGWDIWMLGRRSSGECFGHGRVRTRTRLTRGDTLLWSDRTSVSAGDPILEAPQGWHGHPVFGTAWFVGLPEDESLLQACREVRLDGVVHGVTRFEHGLWLARALGHSAERVRAVLTRTWQLTRPALFKAPGTLPRIWAT